MSSQGTTPLSEGRGLPVEAFSSGMVRVLTITVTRVASGRSVGAPRDPWPLAVWVRPYWRTQPGGCAVSRLRNDGQTR